MQNGCWDPCGFAPTPFPWPPQTITPWVQTTSVYFKNQLVEQPLTDKEKSQLLDLREDWGAKLVNYVWEWNKLDAPPLRFMVEFVLSALPCLQVRTLAVNPESKDSDVGKTLDCFDWSHTRDPTLHLETDPIDPRSALKCWIYFAWHWDATDTVNISVATKADDAEIDLSLWNVGGDGPGMEDARAVIRNFLRRCWIRRLTCEAAKRFSSYSIGSDLEQEHDQEAFIDCLDQCSKSTCWEWIEGSQLLFWRWLPVWRHEAHDGSPGFHTTSLTQRYKFSQVPITDSWVKGKIVEKLRALIEQQYITPGIVYQTIPYCAVPKGLLDIRLVWDCSKNGVNGTMYTPSFQLPTPASYHLVIEP